MKKVKIKRSKKSSIKLQIDSATTQINQFLTNTLNNSTDKLFENDLMEKTGVKSAYDRFKKPAIIIFFVLISILFIISVVKFGIYLSLLTGQDIVIKLDQSHTSILLTEGEKQEVRYTVTANKNPLCASFCKTKFEDISYEKTISEDEFSLGTVLPYTKTFSINAQKKQGIDMYRFSVECGNVESFFCDSLENPSKREVLLFAETNLKNSTKSEIAEKQISLANMINLLNLYYGTLKNYSLLNDENNPILLEKVEDMRVGLNSLEILWQNQEFDSFLKLFAIFESDFEKINVEFESYLESLETFVKDYNNKIDLINNYYLLAENISTIDILESVNSTDVGRKFISPVDINLSLEELNESYSNLISLKSSLTQESLKTSLKISISHDLFYDVLCDFNLSCVKHANISSRASESPELLSSVCDEQIDVNKVNNTQLFLDKRIQKINEYQNLLPTNLTYSKMIKEILDEGYGNEIVPKCVVRNLYFSIPQIPPKLNFNNRTLYASDFFKADFSEIIPMCCVRNDCRECCTSCGNDNLPILFLHGHAFSKDLSAEYSYDVFNKIIENLDKDLFVTAGIATSYRDLNIDYVPNASFMIRGSYYFDLFSKKDTSVLIPAKGENIDTYAIRLKELVNIIKQKTGKDKVIIIAHSMGGLVSRRYLQLFGSQDVEKLVMIGTPNNGINNQTASLCNTLYETLVCRDMKKGSSFMNNLNSEKLPDIEIVNIIGRGCEIDGGDSDGAVLVDEAFVEGAQNYYIDGECTNIDLLHTQILNADLYPKVIEIIEGELNTIELQN